VEDLKLALSRASLPIAVLLAACTTAHTGSEAPGSKRLSGQTAAFASRAIPEQTYGVGMMEGMHGRMGQGPYGAMGPGMMMGPGYSPTPPTEQPQRPQSPGARLAARYCTQCHELPSPAQHTPTQWPAVVVRMQGYMHSYGPQIAHPTEAQAQTLVQYLERQAARDEAAKGSMP
jgi:hypothetical protein